jgi:hypothetical protein
MNWDRITEMLINLLLYTMSIIVIVITLFTLWIYSMRCIEHYQ